MMLQIQFTRSSQAASKSSRVETKVTHIFATTSGSARARRTPLLKSDVPSKGSLHVASVKASLQNQVAKEARVEMTPLFIRCVVPFTVTRTSRWKKTIGTISNIQCKWICGRVLPRP